MSCALREGVGRETVNSLRALARAGLQHRAWLADIQADTIRWCVDSLISLMLQILGLLGALE